MLPSFTVVAENTRIFRTCIKSVTANIRLTANQSKVYFLANFDSFRTFTSPIHDTLSDLSEWKDYEMLFVYETEYSHLLLAKRFTLSFLCHDAVEATTDSFLGEAGVDLLSLAAGPRDVELTVMNGDVRVGTVNMVVEMEEMTETQITVNRVVFSIQESRLSHTDSVYVTASTKNPVWTLDLRADDAAHCQRSQDSSKKETVVTIDSPDPPVTHFIGTSLQPLYESDALILTIEKKGVLANTTIGSASIQFGRFLKASDQSSESFEPTLRFDNVDLLDDGTIVGRVSGELLLKNLPLFVQMYSGRNVDGVVHGAKPYPIPGVVLPAQIEDYDEQRDVA